METKAHSAPRVLGDFGAIGPLALRGVLGSEDFAVVMNGATVEELLARVAEGATDVVVLDQRTSGPVAAAKQIAREHPDVKVIVCSLDEPTMHVFPGWGGRSYGWPLHADGLANAVRAVE